MSKPYVALVGRANTGKSTLFNKFVGERVSIVQNVPGVTRDRIITQTEWCGNAFYVIDTGGIEPVQTDMIPQQMRRQAAIAMDMADVIVLMVDARLGLSATDMEIADMIRKSKAKCVLAVNKIDEWSNNHLAYQFFDLGLGEPLPISAEHGLGLGDLLDKIVSLFPEEDKNEELDERTKIAVVGRPNVGKSTLINTLLGEDRVIVSDIAGTTRDAVDTDFDYNGEQFVLIDTAGIRRKNKAYASIDYYASVRAARAIERSDICLLLIDATQGVTEQDTKIAGMIQDAEKAVVIVINKWDLVEKETNTMSQMEKEIRNRLYFLSYAPFVFISAIDGARTHKLMPEVISAINEYSRRISTGLLNEVIGDAVMMNSPPSQKGRQLKIFYASQPAVRPPTFVLFVNDESLAPRQYIRYLEGKIRGAFEFKGSPLKLVIRSREDK